MLDLALRTGEALLATGAGVADVTLSMQRMAARLGLPGTHVDAMFNSLTVSLDRDEGALTRLRVVEVRTSDYSRLAALTEMVDDVASGRMALVDATARLDEIVSQPHPYRRWVVTAALGLMAAAVAVLLGGGWQVALLAAATTAVIDRSLRLLRRAGLPYLFQQALGAAVASLVALLLLWGDGAFGWDITVMPPSLVVASGIVVLLAGLSLVGAAQDAISGFPITAAGRSFEVVLYTLGIVVGVGAVLDLGRRFGVPLQIADTPGDDVTWPWQIAAAVAISGAWAIASYARPRAVVGAAAIGGLGLAVNLLVGAVGLGPAGRAFVAALAIGVVAGVVARRGGTPAMVLTVCGIVPMLPGLAIYRAMFTIVESGNLISGTDLMLQAVATGLALAAGVSLGEFVARTFRASTDRFQHALTRRARGTRI